MTPGFSFAAPRRRRRGEPVVPMINVVFLLLIFFLMTARIAPPDALDITPATARDSAQLDSTQATLWLDRGGEIIFQGQTGDAAWQALAARPGRPILVQADGEQPARELARLLTRLAGIGLRDVSLVTDPAGGR